MKNPQLPAPVIRADAGPFWEAAQQGKLLLKRCGACTQAHFYPRPHCPFCGAPHTEWIEAAGSGRVYSFSIIRAAARPTAAVVVELEEGVSLTSIVVDADVHALAIGDPVVVTTIPAEGGQRLPVFTTEAANRARAYAARALQASQQAAGVARDHAPMAWRSAAVVGAGTMGIGIATALIRAGIDVCLIDQGEAALQRAREQVQANLAAEQARGRLSAEQLQQAIARLRSSVRIEEVAGANLVIEAVWEQMGLKRDVFAQLDAHADADAILATNTSTLDIDRIADATRRPGAVIGLHFFTPAHVMPLLEIVRGPRTQVDTVAAAQQLARELHKTGVVVGICDGFVGNRLMIAREREAARLLLEGALPQQVDRVLREFGLPMGTFELADMTSGIELGYRLRQETGVKEPIVDGLVALDRLGQKAGKGYYRYEAGQRKPLVDPEVTAFIEGLSAAQGITRHRIPDIEVRDRLVLPMVNEGARLLEEGIAERAGDIDVIWQRGFGWPAWKGGPMYYADEVGLTEVRNRMAALEAAHGERFRAAPLIHHLAAIGGRFTDPQIGHS